jgi:hypothetical protein
MNSKAATFVARAGVVLFASLLAISLQAQVATAVLSGTVTDPAGKAVTAARISAKNTTTGSTTDTVTDSAGRYDGLSLPPGDYEVSVAAPGFSTTITKLTITTSGRQTVNLSLRGLISLEDIGFAEAQGSAADQARLGERREGHENQLGEPQSACCPGVDLGRALFDQRLLRDCRSQDPRNEEQREHALAQGVGLGSRRGDDPDSDPWRHGL